MQESKLCCFPVGIVERSDVREPAAVSGKGRVIEYNEEIMRRPARIRFYKEYCEAIEGYEPGDLAWIIWYAHKSRTGGSMPLKVRPFMDQSMEEVGVFKTRSPWRPCPLGLTLVVVLEVEGCSVIVAGLDAVDGTPVLDVKPYTPGLDRPEVALSRARETLAHHNTS
ncbi:MAG: tRNA (N6-threonylcarbamoyladenosine(37)-N6)-methyltransferase TrmO [Desulfurococcales archaeon]|nr:tRNA (N6-threonylcarbamoyladenosine(37)-N6)-methyltransferase TrmO [Desulfurococcales archaeon]